MGDPHTPAARPRSGPIRSTLGLALAGPLARRDDRAGRRASCLARRPSGRTCTDLRCDQALLLTSARRRRRRRLAVRVVFFCCCFLFFIISLSTYPFKSSFQFFFLQFSFPHPPPTIHPGLVLDLVNPTLGVRGQEPNQASRLDGWGARVDARSAKRSGHCSASIGIGTSPALLGRSVPRASKWPALSRRAFSPSYDGRGSKSALSCAASQVRSRVLTSFSKCRAMC